MKKKIVALLCAAALAFGVPATAFGMDGVVDENGTLELSGSVKLDGGAISDIKFTNINDAIGQINIKRSASLPTVPTNAIPGSVSACDIQAKKEGTFDDTLIAGLGQYATLSLKYTVKDSVIQNLPASMEDNIYVAGRFANNVDGANIPLVPTRLSLNNNGSAELGGSGASASLVVQGVATGTLTLWLQAGKYAVGAADPVPTDPDADDNNDEPREIDGMPELPVSGSSGVVAWGNLAGVNIPVGANISLSAAVLTNGTAYAELRAAMGSGQVIGAFKVDLDVNGVDIHNGFGELNLAFPVTYGLDGRAATVWHRHNDGSITSERTTVVGSEVHITTRDLSDFAIELGSTESAVPDDGTTSPKTGQSVPAGTPLVALGAVVILGAASVLFAKRKMTR